MAPALSGTDTIIMGKLCDLQRLSYYVSEIASSTCNNYCNTVFKYFD